MLFRFVEETFAQFASKCGPYGCSVDDHVEVLDQMFANPEAVYSRLLQVIETRGVSRTQLRKTSVVTVEAAFL